MTTIDRHPPYLFSTCLNLKTSDREALFRLFEKTPAAAGGALAGRTGAVHADIPGVGSVVIKHYRRGGLVRHLVKDVYLRLGKSRARCEYEMLETVRSLGVSSPEPLLWAIRGSLIYRAWLVTRRVEGHRSLLDIAVRDPALSRSAVAKTADQIRCLLTHRIHHVDLHPGNVLVDGAGQVYLIDFDKARRVSWRREKLRVAYVNRWKRAVEKYSLPALMTEQLVGRLKVED